LACKSYETNKGSIIEDFGNLNDLAGNANVTMALETTIKQTGASSLKMTSITAGAICVVDKTNIAWNIADGDVFSMWLYIDDIAKVATSGLNLYIAADNGSFTNYYRVFISWYGLRSGWNLMRYHTDEFVNDATSPSWSNTQDCFRINFTAAAGETPVIYMDSMRQNWTTKAYVLTIYDDGFYSPYDKIYQKYKDNDQRYSVGVVSDLVGYSGYISEDLIISMYKEGFDFVNHTSDHTNLTSVSEAVALTKIGDCQDYLNSLAIERASNYFIYPQNAYNDTVIGALQTLGYEYARAGQVAEQSLPFDQNFKLCTMLELDDSVTTTNIEDAIDEVILKGGLCIFYGHEIVDSGASGSLEVNLAVAEHIVDYVVSNSDDVKAITFSDIDKIINNPSALATGSAGNAVDGKDYVPSGDYLVIRPATTEQIMLMNLYSNQKFEVYMSNDIDYQEGDAKIRETFSEGGTFLFKDIITNDNFIKIKNTGDTTSEIGYSGFRVKGA